jgi:hypothetical protein
VTVSVVEYEEVTVMVVSPDQSPEGGVANAKDATNSRTAAKMEWKCILMVVDVIASDID